MSGDSYHVVFLPHAVNIGIMPVESRSDAVLLRDDSIGVSTETKPRKVQVNGDGQSYEVTVNRDWLQQLNLADRGSQTVHSLSLGLKPVVVQHPAIIIQPASVLGEVSDE